MKALSGFGSLLVSNGLFVIAVTGLLLLGAGLTMKYDAATALTIVGAIMLTLAMFTVLRLSDGRRPDLKR
jgi:hypothetical protein